MTRRSNFMFKQNILLCCQVAQRSTRYPWEIVYPRDDLVIYSRGDWVQLQQGTIATKIKKGVKYFLVVLKKSPFEHHMGKQLCVKFGWNRLRTSAAIDVFVFLGLFENASGAVKNGFQTEFQGNWKLEIYKLFVFFSSFDWLQSCCKNLKPFDFKMGKSKPTLWGTVATRCCNRTAHAFQMALRFYGE
jgi:hypothetical protein